MTLFELGALGEFVGAVLLVFSLVYVGLQIRQNTAVAKAQIYQARADSAQQFFLSQAMDPAVLRFLTDALARPIDELDPAAQRQLMFWHLASLARMDNNYYQYQAGFLEAEYYETVLVPVIAQNAQTWIDLGLEFRPTFRAEVDRILSLHD